MSRMKERLRVIRGGLDYANSFASMAPATEIDYETMSDLSMTRERAIKTEEEWNLYVCRRLQQLESLEDRWDSYDAGALAKSTIIFTAIVLTSVWPEARPWQKPAITPMSDGTIMIEWRSTSCEITVEVHAPNDVSVLIENLQTGNTEESRTKSNFTKIINALKACNRVEAVA